MELLNTEVFNSEGVLELVIRLGLNCLVLFAVLFLWNKNNANRSDFTFTLGLFNLITFLICFILRQVPMEMGFALGLFAVFGILRYRTETVPAKAISYLFISIGLALVNALSNDSISWVEIGIANLAILLAMYLFEAKSSKVKIQILVLEDLSLLDMNTSQQFEYLSKKTNTTRIKGLNIEEIDYVRDTIRLTISAEVH